jgi:low affinity Fe/Cu permease
MANGANGKGPLVRVGDRISDLTSRLFAHPAMQVAVLIFCVAWFMLGLHADLLTAALSVLAITLTQMVLNGQYDREADDHRRDVAMHAKLDELLIAMKGARDEMAGIEELDEQDIEQLKEQVKQAIDAKGEEAGNARERAAAKAAVDKAANAAAKR